MDPSLPTQALLAAVHTNDLAAVDRALAQGTDPAHGGHHAFVQAAAAGHLDVLHRLWPWAQTHATAPSKALYRAVKNQRPAAVAALVALKVTLIPDHARFLLELGELAVLDQVQAPLPLALRQRQILQAAQIGDEAQVRWLLKDAPTELAVDEAFGRALTHRHEAIAQLLWPYLDLRLLETQWWTSKEFAKLDALACMVDTPERARMVQELGTRNLPRATERHQVDRRHQAVVTAPVVVPSRPRCRS